MKKAGLILVLSGLCGISLAQLQHGPLVTILPNGEYQVESYEVVSNPPPNVSYNTALPLTSVARPVPYYAATPEPVENTSESQETTSDESEQAVMEPVAVIMPIVRPVAIIAPIAQPIVVSAPIAEPVNTTSTTNHSLTQPIVHKSQKKPKHGRKEIKKPFKCENERDHDSCSNYRVSASKKHIRGACNKK